MADMDGSSLAFRNRKQIKSSRQGGHCSPRYRGTAGAKLLFIERFGGRLPILIMKTIYLNLRLLFGAKQCCW